MVQNDVYNNIEVYTQKLPKFHICYFVRLHFLTANINEERYSYISIFFHKTLPAYSTKNVL